MTERPDSTSRSGAPQVVGPYHIVQLIGEGGMGVVYDAEQFEPVRRRVALKMMKPGMDSREVVARFEAERQALAVMDHPGIAKVLDAGVADDGRPYFVMELVRGVRIDEYCDRFRLTLRERVELFIQLCLAVQHAHQKGVIHRDLKPSNVLVAEQDGRAVPKVIDFGIAKATGWQPADLPALTSLGVPIGTLAYMSPEQAESSELDVDTRADIYSLGVMLYEVLSGTVPVDLRVKGAPAFLAELISRDTTFPTPTQRLTATGDAVRRIATSRGTNPDGLKKALSGDIQWVVMRAMEKDRARRYNTANGLALELRRYLNDEPVLARPPSAAYRLSKLVRRHRGVVAALSVAALALAVGTVAATVGMVRARAAREAALAAEQQAATEARTATQVSDFLVNLFEMNDPSESGGATVTAREILDRGADRVKTQLGDDPVVQARLMGTIGSVYDALGLYDNALDLLKRANALQEANLSPTDPELAKGLRLLGAAQQSRGGDLESAERSYRRALAILRQETAPDSTELARTIAGLGATVLSRGRAEEADSLLRRAMDIEERIPGLDDGILAKTVRNLGAAAYYRGKYPEAAQYYSRTVAMEQRRFGRDAPGAADALNNLGAVYFMEGHYDEALAAYQRAKDIWTKTLPPGHPRLAAALTNIGETYDKLGRYKEAEPLLLQALRIKERTLSPDETSNAVTLRVLADVYRDEGRYKEAEPRYLRAIQILEDALGPKHPRLGMVLDGYAKMLRASGRNDEAARVEARRAALNKN
ncbi:MAG: serine/threonine-protein kinase [Gemmatimonadetes bacterium]|nr:serine/threonine-protein kinase [Gemmatimonadota bacterium]